MPADELPELPPRSFAKIDDATDDVFYSIPRFVTHIDDGAIAAVTQLYRELFAPGATILDLMGSWVAHLPPEISYAEVIGHGMNQEELAANPRYHRWFVHDLNASPALPLADASVDAVAICVSIQYLQQPVAVFREVLRVLRPGGLVAITFSNRCFPTKAVAIWRALEGDQHQHLVALYLDRAGFATVEPRTLIDEGLAQDPLWAVIGRKAGD
ncbi:MAG TPA: methyltransferase domain-containing protein [Stellaceae bacterium]|nr:methyltransferase domain-containing protein [Stellaceae bacterium]